MKAHEGSASVREKTLVIAGPSGGAWRGVAWHLDLKFSGLVDLRGCRVSFVKFLTSLHKFKGLFRGVSKDFGGAWQRIRPFLGLKFSGFVDRGPMD